VPEELPAGMTASRSRSDGRAYIVTLSAALRYIGMSKPVVLVATRRSYMSSTLRPSAIRAAATMRRASFRPVLKSSPENRETVRTMPKAITTKNTTYSVVMRRSMVFLDFMIQ